MTDAHTRFNAALDHPGMDYAFLRKHGIDLIAKLAGDRWTDYNPHDPGITILEAWCYALTDLSYRLDFAIEDLFATPPGESAPFLSARDSLTVQPLTINDYRKLLIDLDEVKNAWLEPIHANPNPLYYYPDDATLTFENDPDRLSQSVYLRGLYRVLIEADPELETDQTDALYAAVTAKLHQHRNLCEDFAEIQILEAEIITVQAELDISNYGDPHQLLAQLYLALDRVISPSVDFLSLSDLRGRDTPIETIFVGPPLAHGFIDDTQLEQCDRQTALRTSDLIHVILDFEPIQTVQTITLSSDQSPRMEDWVLDLNHQKAPRLKSLDAIIRDRDITLYQHQTPCEIDPDQVQTALTNLRQAKATNSALLNDLPIPIGSDRSLADYESLQSEFPLAYGIGETGLPASASPQRQAQAKQLQAYLMVLDQLLANYFSQLEQVRTLFNPRHYPNPKQSYFTQVIDQFPGAQALLKDTYHASLNHVQEDKKNAHDRISRFLDHLAAQYGEIFVNSSLLNGNLIEQKFAFNTQYLSVSSARSQGFNYQLNPNPIENVSGLKRRVALLLGLDPNRRSLVNNQATESNQIEGFYLVEHILLRPCWKPDDREALKPDDIEAGFMELELESESESGLQSESESIERESTQTHTPFHLSKLIINYSLSDSQQVICTTRNHGLQIGETITILNSDYAGQVYTVQAESLTDDTFTLNANFIPDYVPEQDTWIRSDQDPDPFSFQVSVVLPRLPKHCDTRFERLFYNTLMTECPAHISLRLHWLDRAQMSEFEQLYDLWLQELSETVDQPEANISRQLINFLGLATIELPDRSEEQAEVSANLEVTDAPDLSKDLEPSLEPLDTLETLEGQENLEAYENPDLLDHSAISTELEELETVTDQDSLEILEASETIESPELAIKSDREDSSEIPEVLNPPMEIDSEMNSEVGQENDENSPDQYEI